jgi:hypothetical protein
LARKEEEEPEAVPPNAHDRVDPRTLLVHLGHKLLGADHQ